MATKKQASAIGANYFVIPAIILLVSWFDKWVLVSNISWLSKLNLPSSVASFTMHFIMWYAVYFYTTLALISFWNNHARNRSFWEITGALAVNLACFLLGHYTLLVSHRIGTAFLFFIGTTISLWYVISRLWPKHRLSAALLLPYGFTMLYTLYTMNAIWTLN